MIMRRTLSLVFLLFVTATVPVHGNELATRMMAQSEVDRAMVEEDFGALNAMARTYREQQSRTGSGVWKLTLFHASVADFIDRIDLCTTCPLSAATRLKRWMAATPNEPAPQIAYAKFLLSRAGRIRGKTMAREVPPTAWAPFKAYVGQAYEHLLEVKPIAAIDPEWYVAMQQASLLRNDDREQYNAILNEGISKMPTYYELYFTAVFYFLPQWHGSLKDLDQLARMASSKTQATDGDGLYARVYWQISEYLLGDVIRGTSEVDWKLMKRSMRDVAKRYPDDWNLTRFARFACTAEDPAEATFYFAQIKHARDYPWRDGRGQPFCPNFKKAK